MKKIAKWWMVPFFLGLGIWLNIIIFNGSPSSVFGIGGIVLFVLGFVLLIYHHYYTVSKSLRTSNNVVLIIRVKDEETGDIFEIKREVRSSDSVKRIFFDGHFPQEKIGVGQAVKEIIITFSGDVEIICEKL